jgi:hypothetical protein
MTITGEFVRCVQDSQEYGSTDQHMVSRVFFWLADGGRRYDDLYVDVKQVAGGDYERDPLEVSRPFGYNGPFNHIAFRAEVESYYRNLVGRAGTGIRLGPGATVRMYNNTFIVTRPFTLEATGGDAAW